MVKKIVLVACIILMATSLSFAQENNAQFNAGDLGLLFSVVVGNPIPFTSVGLIYHITGDLALMPILGMGWSLSDNKLTTTTTATLTPSVQIALLYYLAHFQNLALNLGPVASFSWSKPVIDDPATKWETSNISFGGGAQLGVEWMVTRVFGLWANIELLYLFSKNYTQQTVKATGVVTITTDSLTHNLDISSTAVGVVFYLR